MSQVKDNHEIVIAYFSQILTKAERNCCMTRKELLDVVKILKPLHKYLYGQRVLLSTVHVFLKRLFCFKNLEAGKKGNW